MKYLITFCKWPSLGSLCELFVHVFFFSRTKEATDETRMTLTKCICSFKQWIGHKPLSIVLHLLLEFFEFHNIFRLFLVRLLCEWQNDVTTSYIQVWVKLNQPKLLPAFRWTLWVNGSCFACEKRRRKKSGFMSELFPRPPLGEIQSFSSYRTLSAQYSRYISAVLCNATRDGWINKRSWKENREEVWWCQNYDFHWTASSQACFLRFNF